ncbi:MAG: hypothetical protein LBB54_02865, partial [Cellulomonadaceae bacterium]|nr:hypothetical protein [Cellulomonadaceae bacterium]
MTWRSDPVDTVRVYGGSPLSVVDATCVRAAAGRVTVARDQLRQAAWNLGRAAEAIERSAYRQATYGNLLSGGGAGGWGAGSLAPGGLPPRGLVAAPTTGGSPSYLVSGQVSAARRRSLAVQARHTAAQLAVQADGCDLTAIRLIKAAGLYEQAESRVSAVVRGQVNGHVQAVSFAAGAYMGVPMMVAGLLYAKVHPVAAGVYLGLTALPIGVSLLSLWGNGKLLDLLVGGYFSRLTGISFDTPLTMMGGSSDETFTGFATGVAAVLPGLSRCDMSLEGGIFALSQGANVLAPDSGIRVSEFFPDALPSSIPGGHGAMLPSWAGVAEGGISERQSRLEETNPNGGWDAG